MPFQTADTLNFSICRPSLREPVDQCKKKKSHIMLNKQKSKVNKSYKICHHFSEKQKMILISLFLK